MAETNLLTLLIQRRLAMLQAPEGSDHPDQKPAKRKKGRKTGLSPGRYRIQAGDLSLLLQVSPGGRPQVLADEGQEVDAAVSGGMRTLLGVLVGEVGMVSAALSFRIRVHGKFWKLLPLLKAFRGSGA